MKTLINIVVAIAAIFGVFILPWYLGGSLPVPGESYVLGFNNKVAIFSLALAILAATLGHLFSKDPQKADTWIDVSGKLLPTWSEAKAEYSILIGWSLLWVTIIFGWGNYLVDPAWCEARSYFYHMDRMSLGQIPFKDFMFIYGPGLLYPELWLSNITGGSLSFEQSYLIVLSLFTVCGFLAIHVFLRILRIPVQYRPAALLMTLLTWSEYTMGLHYTPLRFYIVPVSLILMDVIVRRVKIAEGYSYLVIFVCSGSAAFACLSVSPEMGIACSAGLGAYGLILLLAQSTGRAFACWGGGLAVVLATFFSFPDYILSIIGFLNGGMNFPFYPNMHDAAMVAISIFVIPSMIAVALKSPGMVCSPLLLALAVGGGMMLPGAMGRCDPGHVLIYSTVPVIMMFPVTAGFGKKYLTAWMATFAFLYIILMQISYWSLYTNNYLSAIQTRKFYDANPALVDSWKAEWDWLRLTNPHGKNFHWSSVLPFPKELEQFTDKGSMLQTANDEGNYWLGRFLVLQENLPWDYFNIAGLGAVTPSQIQRKIREADKFKYLIVPEWDVAGLDSPTDLRAYEQSRNGFLSKLLLFPVNCHAKNQPYRLDSDFLKTITKSYSPIAKYQNFLILEKCQVNNK